nr:semenogelin-2 [Callithrix jacchus]
MKPIIFFVLSLLLILEKQAAVMGQKGGSKGQLPSESSQFPHEQKGQQYSARKDKQHAESKGSVYIEHIYHVDVHGHDQTRKSKQYDLNAQNKTIKSEKHAAGSQEPFNHKQESREHGKSKGDFHVLIIHHKGGHAPHGTQNPSQDQGNSTSGKGISSQDSNTKESLLALGLGKEQDSVSGTQRNRTQGGSQSSPVLQTEDPVHNKKPETQNSLQNKGSSPNVNETKQKHSSKVQTPLCSAQEDRLQCGSKDVFSKNQNQTRNPNQDQEHGQKAHNRSCQCSSTEERPLNHGEKGIQKDASKGSTSNQTEDKIHDKSQKQVTTPSQDQWSGQEAKGKSGQSADREKDLLSCDQKGRRQHGSHGGLDIVIIEHEADNDHRLTQHHDNNQSVTTSGSLWDCFSDLEDDHMPNRDGPWAISQEDTNEDIHSALRQGFPSKMKPIIFFVLSLLLILEKQAAVMGQKGGSKGRLPSESSQFPHGQKGQQYSAQKDKQHAESKGSVYIEHIYHVDVHGHDQTRKSKQYDLNAQNKTIKSEKHAAGSQEPFNHKQESREHGKSKGDFHVLIIHHKGGHAPHGTQNPSQDQGNSTSGKGISSQDSNTKESLLALGLGKEQDSVSGTQRNRTQGGSQSSPVLQTEDPVHNKKPETQNSLQNKGSSPNVNETKQKHSSKVQTPLCSAQEDRLQCGSKDVFSKNQNQKRNPNQDQEHGQKAHNRSCQCSSTEERPLNHGEKGIQKDASKGSTSNQTEDKIHDKSQKQVTTPSQEDGHRANKTSSRSSGTAERRPNHGEKGIQKDASKGSSSNKTEDKIHDKPQKQITTPSQDQRSGQDAKGKSGLSADKEKDLLIRDQKGRHQEESSGAHNIVIIEHEVSHDHHLAQHHDKDQNRLIVQQPLEKLDQ